MRAAVTAAGPAESLAVSRVAATGAPVDLTLPAVLGEYRWYGSTRFAGPRLARQFFLAPAGEHRAIPTHLMPGAREIRRSLRGADAVVFEAPDRSDSALVLAGPHHEATTWFGGPAPDAAGIERLLATFRFTDSTRGASLVPTSDLLVGQSDTALIGRNAGSVLIARPAVDVLPTLPDWAGLRLPGGELWRGGRVLPDADAALVTGTAHQWRYILVGEDVAMDLVFLGPEAGRPALPLGEDDLLAALAVLDGSWAG
ncbi:MAG TPA: hypothetical protein VM367_18470 [Pseudonocardia sp.]|nr:hypothetical protein [Pseudonocardia sp.]